MMQKSKTDFIYHTHNPRYEQKFAASSKNGKLFVTDFYDFYFAVNASENDAKSRKSNSFITNITRDMDQKMLPAAKMESFCHRFYDFYFAVSASENDAKSRKPNSFITPITRDKDQKLLPEAKMENFCHLFMIFILQKAHMKTMNKFENRIQLSHPLPEIS